MRRSTQAPEHALSPTPHAFDELPPFPESPSPEALGVFALQPQASVKTLAKRTTKAFRQLMGPRATEAPSLTDLAAASQRR